MTATGGPHDGDTLIMVRTVCCEGYKQFGQRCLICPNRPENRQAVRDYKECKLTSLHGSGLSHPSAVEHPGARNA